MKFYALLFFVVFNSCGRDKHIDRYPVTPTRGCVLAEGDHPPMIVCNGQEITPIGEEGAPGHSCTVTQQDTGALITCEDGTHAFVSNGQNGEDGEDGEKGVDGINGIDGLNGIDGEDGQGCTAISTENGALIQCGETTAVIYNGTDGEDGEDGVDAGVYQISEIIDPCGDNPGKFDEVLLRFGTGELLAYFESGSSRFLSVLPPGNYQTTDQQKCNFSISATYEVTW